MLFTSGPRLSSSGGGSALCHAAWLLALDITVLHPRVFGSPPWSGFVVLGSVLPVSRRFGSSSSVRPPASLLRSLCPFRAWLVFRSVPSALPPFVCSFSLSPRYLLRELLPFASALPSLAFWGCTSKGECRTYCLLHTATNNEIAWT